MKLYHRADALKWCQRNIPFWPKTPSEVMQYDVEGWSWHQEDSKEGERLKFVLIRDKVMSGMTVPTITKTDWYGVNDKSEPNVHLMELHTCLTVINDTFAVRVPGGWIYNIPVNNGRDHTINSVFVPYNEEFFQ